MKRFTKILFGIFAVWSFFFLFNNLGFSATIDCDLARLYVAKGFRDSSYYKKAIELCSGYIRPYELYGDELRKKGYVKKAIEYFKSAADLGSNNHKLYYLLASLLFQQGDLNDSYKYIKKSLSIKSNYPKAIDLNIKIEAMFDSDGPKIIIFEPSVLRGIKVTYKYENLTVRGITTDKSGVLWVKVNDISLSVDEHGNFLKDIPIHSGENTIIIEASDRLDNRSKKKVVIHGEKVKLSKINKVESTSDINQLYDKSFAVVIGINKYEKWPALEFAVADALSVKESFEKAGFDDISIILDKEATQNRILTELYHELPNKVGRNDRLVFYFAGHGQTEDLKNGGKKGYIIPVDSDVSNYSTTAISMGQIRSLSNRIPAKHILYIMDSCYSGLGLNRSSGASPKIDDYIRKVSAMRAVQIVTAGGKGEQVQEKEGHGIFTTYFLKALNGEADINKDNVVTGTELGAYLRPRVSNASDQAQTPLYGRLEGEGEFLFFVVK